MSRVIRFHGYGGPEVLRIEEVDVRAPAAGEVRIRVKALGLNRAEALLRSGTYIEAAVFPSGLGLEAAGTIESTGPGVDTVAPGDAVSVIPPVSMVRWPAYGELIVVPAAQVVRLHAPVDWEAAAATWMAYLTAYGALVDVARVGPGDFVAITAASSSVGLASIQMARRVGAVPIAITRTSRKRAALLAAGAAHVIASTEEDLAGRLVEISGALGVRVVIDAVGGPIFEPLAAAMSRDGVLVEYGGLSQEPTPFPLLHALAKRLTFRGYLVHELLEDPIRLEAGKRFITEGLAAGTLRPVIARTFPFDEIVAAHRFLESNDQFGKVVVTV